MLAAITVLLAGTAVATACWFALCAIAEDYLGIHHMQWLILSVLIVVALPSLSWDREVFASLFSAYGVTGAECWATLTAWTCTAAAAAVLLNRRLIRRLFGAGLQEF